MVAFLILESDTIMATVSLVDLQKQIAQREQELQALRQELESRQSELSALTSRKTELQSQLEKVEEEIATLASAVPTPPKQPTVQIPTARPALSPTAPVAGQPRLADLIVVVLREAGKPMTSRQVSEEAQRRGYQTTGRDPVKSVETRLIELKNRGVVQRAVGQPGYILVPAANGATKEKSKVGHSAPTSTTKAAAKPAKPISAVKKNSVKGSTPAATAQTAKPGRRGGQPPLRVVLTGILRSSRKPLSGSELAEQALAAGYQSGSKKFVDTVWAMLGQMDNVEHVPEKGYRLKKKT